MRYKLNKKEVPSNFNELLTTSFLFHIASFLSDYNDWIRTQLEQGGLIFSPEDYYGIWRSKL